MIVPHDKHIDYLIGNLFDRYVKIIEKMKKEKADVLLVDRLWRTLSWIRSQGHQNRLDVPMLQAYLLYAHKMVKDMGESRTPFGAIARLASRDIFAFITEIVKTYPLPQMIVTDDGIFEAQPSYRRLMYKMRNGEMDYNKKISEVNALLLLNWVLPNTPEALNDIEKYSKHFNFEFKASGNYLIPTKNNNPERAIILSMLLGK